MASWLFDTSGSWQIRVSGAPTEETKRAYWAEAVPTIAAAELGPAPAPCIVVALVQAPSPPGRLQPAGPRGRAKALLDALHDDRRSGPKYRDLGVPPPLEDDSPEYVTGLAVEVRPGPQLQTEYRLGRKLHVNGSLLRAVDVAIAAPNDIVGTPGEKAAIAAARREFAAATRRAWAEAADEIAAGDPVAVVIRHQPGRDEDNTWATWVGALCGTVGMTEDSPWFGAPLAGWAPAAIASLADPILPEPTRFELYAVQ